MIGRASWVLSADGAAHLPMLEGPGLLITGCRQSLPDAAPQSGVVPQGRPRCAECFAALFALPPDLVFPPPRSRLVTGRTLLPRRVGFPVASRFQPTASIGSEA